MSARSYLFVPGDRRDMLDKAGQRGSDALIADLEDAVAPSRKAEARDSTAGWLRAKTSRDLEVWVRVNHTPDLLVDDIRTVVGFGLTGLMIPKVRGVEELQRIAELLDSVEPEAGLEMGSIGLLVIVETATGLLACSQLARAPRVRQLMIGELDLSAELGTDPTDVDAMTPLRMQVVVASAAAGLDAPLGPVSPDYRNLDELRRETRALARQGFGARPAIHPAQVPVFNEVFTPDAAAVRRAQRLVDLYEAALAEGRGTATDDEGHMVDEAVVRVARALLDRARRAERAS